MGKEIMDRLRLNQIMNILLMPYKERELINEDNDYLNNVRCAYYLASKAIGQSMVELERQEIEYKKGINKLDYFLKNHQKLRINSLDDTKQLINLFFPEEDIIRLFENYGEEKYKECINVWYIRNIFRISESLLTFRDGKVAIRTWVNKKDYEGNRDIFDYHDALNKVEIWNILSRMVVPDLFVAAFYVISGLTDKEYLLNQAGNVSLADKELDVVLKKGIAETHMHFNAGIHYLILWEEVLNPYIWYNRIKFGSLEYQKPEEKWILHVIIYRIIMAEYSFYIKDEIDLCEYIAQKYGNISIEIYEVLHEFKEGKQIDKKRVEQIFLYVVERWKLDYGKYTENNDFLFESVYRNEIMYSSVAELFFQIQVLEKFRNNPTDVHSMHMFIQYLRVKNCYFESCIQSDTIKGVRNFQKYYSKATKRQSNDKKSYNRRIRAVFESQIQNINLRKMEIRICPPLFLDIEHFTVPDKRLKYDMKCEILLSIKDIFEEYLKCMRELLDKNGLAIKEIDKLRDQGIAGVPAIGIIFHFIKSDFLDNRLGNACWLQNVSGNQFYNKHILAYREKMIRSAMAIEELRSEIPFLNEYIVGIDSASEEFLSEPWVMAPVYQAIRNKKITKPVIKGTEGEFRRIQNIGFTYHVGEEFRHLLSGFRYVDEVIERFGYKAGDRIGHAVVLGVDIEHWMKKNEVVVLPINEYLEDLIWLWGNIVYEKMHLPVSMEIIEGKIMDLAQEVYGDILGITPFLLYQAYNEKFKQYHYETFRKMKNNININREPGVGNHFCKYYDTETSTGIFWTKEKLVCTYFCPVFWQRFQKTILVPVNMQDAQLYQAIQQYLIRKIERRGIYVETNPTSNSVIGEIPGILCHHILKLNSEGLDKNQHNSTLVTINSDDPIVFNTNCENEIAYIYYALQHNNYNEESILRWIDKIRQFGMDSSFIRDEKKPSQQIQEIEKILEEIEAYVKHP